MQDGKVCQNPCAEPRRKLLIIRLSNRAQRGCQNHLILAHARGLI